MKVSRRRVPHIGCVGSHARTLSVFGLALLLPSVASAHMGRIKHVEATTHEAGAHLEVRLSAVDAAVGLGLSTQASDETLIDNAELLSLWLGARMLVGSDAGECTNTSHEVRVVTDNGKRTMQVSLTSVCPAEAKTLSFRDESLRDHDDHETVVTFGEADERQVHILRDADNTLVISQGRSTMAVAGTFIYEGIVHLVTGYDHLLFLLSLILAAGLLGRREGGVAALKSTALLATAFTLGHSVTLVIAALQWFTLPIGPVEAVIALSIVLVAGLNIVRPSFHEARPWLACGFGLIHGFGFSSVLGDVGLPTANRVVALLSFNVGIELGQLAFVAVVLVPLIWMARRSWYRSVVMTGGSAVVACVGLFWFAERAFAI